MTISGQTESMSGNVSDSDRPSLFFVHLKKKRVYWNVRHLLWNGTKCPRCKHKGKDTKSSILFFKCFSFQAKTDQRCTLFFSLKLFVYIHRVQRSAGGRWTTVLHNSATLRAVRLIIDIQGVSFLLLQVFAFRSQVTSSVFSLQVSDSKWKSHQTPFFYTIYGLQFLCNTHWMCLHCHFLSMW